MFPQVGRVEFDTVPSGTPFICVLAVCVVLFLFLRPLCSLKCRAYALTLWTEIFIRGVAGNVL